MARIPSASAVFAADADGGEHLNTSQSNFPRYLARHWSLLLSMSFGSALAHIATTGMPLQVGALMDGTARSASQAGLFAFIEVASLSLGMILISFLAIRIKPLHLAIGGSLLAALADLSLFVAREFPLQLVLGSFAGLGFGMAYSATIAAGASSEDADRTYAIGFGGSLLLVMLIMIGLPFTSAQLGLLGVFACMSGFALFCAPIFRGFKGAAIQTPARSHPVRLAVWRIPGATGLLFSWAAFSMGTAMAYVFAERIARNIPLPPTDIGLVLSSGVLVGVAGTGVAALVSQRLNRRVSLVCGLAGSALACFLIGHATTLVLFATGIFAYWIFTMFLYCFLLGTAAILDKSGRLGTFGSGTERLGYAVGAWMGGLLAQHVSYTSTGTFGCAVCVAGIIIGYPTLFRALTERSLLDTIGAKQVLSCDDCA
jgi:predicted MFS family arabinose efflux permease